MARDETRSEPRPGRWPARARGPRELACPGAYRPCVASARAQSLPQRLESVVELSHERSIGIRYRRTSHVTPAITEARNWRLHGRSNSAQGSGAKVEPTT